MQHRYTSVALAGFLGALVLMTTPSISLAWPHHSAGWRMHNQQHRIYQGVRQEQIAGGEYRRLEREQFRTAQLRYRFRHNDGHIGPREQARLQHRLNHTSRDIYLARHN